MPCARARVPDVVVRGRVAGGDARAGVGDGRREVEQGVDAVLAAAGPGQGAHGVDEGRDRLGDRDRREHEERLDRGRDGEVLGDDRGDGDGRAHRDEEEGGCGRATGADAPGDPVERGVGVVEPAERGRPAADGAQLAGLARHQLADACHLGAGGEQLWQGTGLEPNGQPADEAHDDAEPEHDEADGQGETMVRAMTMPPATAVEMTGTVTRTWASTTSVRSSTTPVSTSDRRRRPSRAGVSGMRAS